MIQVRIAKVSMSNMGFVVLLRAPQDQRTLPVFIGPAEAQAIMIHIDKVQVPRPLTHDLMKNLLDHLEWRLSRIEVSDLIDNTFYARLVLEHDGVETQVDSRPSDAIALALRCGTPIYVAEKVMEQAGVILPEEEPQPPKPQPPSKKRELSPVDVLKAQIEKAISEERYEDAARLRDEIKKHEESAKK
jgi:bifunctional DNase/RNase